jgi:hypothetical protein
MNTDEEIKKKNPFKVPDGYFESLTERTMSAIKATGKLEEAEKHEERPARRLNLRPFIALAAVITAFAVITTIAVRLVTGDRDNMKPVEAGELYAELAVEDIDIYLIESEWNRAEMPATREVEETISTDAIIDYLTMENIDLTDIYELL